MRTTKRFMMMSETEDDHQTRVLYELCSMIFHILRYPSLPIPFPTSFISSSAANSTSSSAASSSRTSQVSSPTAFAALFLGISMALMLFGSITFVIGFILMPWVVGLVFLFYVAGIASNLSDLGLSILYPGVSRRSDFADQPSSSCSW